MNSSGIPSRTSTIFAASGEYNTIAETSTTTTLADGTVTMDVGYPPLTMTPISSGGTPPQGEDTNGIFNRIFTKLQWTDAGGGYPFSASFASAVGGYPSGAVIPSSDGSGEWINTIDANSTSPEGTASSSTGWVPLSFYGVASPTISASSITMTCLDAAKPIIYLAGKLTNNIYVYVPSWKRRWIVINSTSGGYNLIFSTVGGSITAVVPSGGAYDVYCDGTGVYRQSGVLSTLDAATIATGGTGATTASGARSNLGLGTVATLNSGTGSGDVPTMNNFTYDNTSSNGASFVGPAGEQICRNNMSLPAKSTTTWTYPKSFTGAPAVSVQTFNASPQYVWLTGATATRCTIYNDSSSSINVNITAIW